jgi:metal-sulfur cluster biosynthetic enzyme
MLDETQIRQALDTIIDPCSMASGLPCGIATMGLVRQVAITPGENGALVQVTIGLTEPTCLMGYIFLPQARAAITALPGVARADIQLVTNANWSEADMASNYRERLAAKRAGRSMEAPGKHEAMQ